MMERGLVIKRFLDTPNLKTSNRSNVNIVASAVSVMGLVFLCSVAPAQQPKTYNDGERGSVTLPLGDLSFGDVVLSVTPGEGKQPIAEAVKSKGLIGPPDYVKGTSTYFTLGCGGVVEIGFTDNALVDVAGPDLYIFEIGPDVEGTILSVSSGDGTWIEVGSIEGGRAEIDLAETPAVGGTYRAVRLTDDGIQCSGRFPGADIDAVAAIGAELRFSIDGAVLFETGSDTLRNAAEAELSALAAEIADAGITRFDVVGHTDSVGSDTANLALSEARAKSVRDFLAAQPTLANAEIQTSGAGEAEPVATNDTKEGRAANRRVEIIARSGS